MNKFSKILAIGFGFGVLAMAWILIPNHQARGAAVPPSHPVQEGALKNAQTLPYRAASDSPAREQYCRPYLGKHHTRSMNPPALSLRSVGRRSMEMRKGKQNIPRQ